MTKLITAESLAIVLLVLVFGFLVVLFTTDSFRYRPVGQRDSGFQLFARRPRRRWPVLGLMLVVALPLGYLVWRQAFQAAAAPVSTSTASTVVMATDSPIPAAPIAVPVAPQAQEPVVVPSVDPALEVKSAIESWRAAWGERDIGSYLEAYAEDFRPADGLTTESWRAQRKDRLGKAGGIRVQIEQLSVEAGGDRATARFLQRYRAGTVNDRVWKRLVLTRTPGGWKINEETVEEPGQR
jgi:ketosteroid isomerase-like protein